jgi:hypothetical protein
MYFDDIIYRNERNSHSYCHICQHKDNCQKNNKNFCILNNQINYPYQKIKNNKKCKK